MSTKAVKRVDTSVVDTPMTTVKSAADGTGCRKRKKTNRSDDNTYDETNYWDKILNSKSWLKRSKGSASKTSAAADTKPDTTTPSEGTPPTADEDSLPEPPLLIPFESELTSDEQLTDEPLLDDHQWLEKITSMPSLDVTICSPKADINDLNDTLDDGLEGQKDHLNISNSEDNVLLSCKGLASMSKVRQYYDSQVIDGDKYFVCKWKDCEFKTKKSQKIAQHINLSHIGVEFKCNKPNCNKVFKNPNTYREHQKNHICGFGIFGYGSKGVIGVCRNENLNKYRERVMIDTKKFYRCKWEDCNAITRYHMAMKRHLHGHVCPYRVNLKLKQNQQVISNMKSDEWNIDPTMTSEATTSGAIMTSSPEQSCDSNISATKKTYQCRRVNCGANFDTKANLVQHETYFCNFIDSIKQIESEMSGNEEIKPNEQTNGSSIANLEMMANVDKYISKKLINGISYNLCVYGNCKYTSNQLHNTIEHIQSQHLALESQLNTESNCSDRDSSIDSSLGESSETEYSSKKSAKMVEIIVNSVSPSKVIVNKSPSKVTPTSTSGSTTTVGQNYVKHTVNGQTVLFCTHVGCDFVTKGLNQMEVHVNEEHNQLFVCEIDNCGKQFKTLLALSHHKRNHICGFNIKGRRPTGVCDLNNIRKYRDQIVIGNRLVYPCRWCPDVIFENRSVALAHAHNKHLCPNRLIVDQQSNTSYSRNVVQRIVETNQKKCNQNINIESSAQLVL